MPDTIDYKPTNSTNPSNQKQRKKYLNILAQ